MPKGNRGGTNNGGASKNANNNAFQNVRVEGKSKNEQVSNEIIKGVQDVLSDFGLESELNSIVYVNSKSNFDASMNGFGDMQINNNKIKNYQSHSDGFLAADSPNGIGTHEAGHAVVNGLLKKYITINPDETNKTSARKNLERATARAEGKLEKSIIKEATKRFGSNPKISGYASKNAVEKVAEAVSDVYTNKSNANAYSKTIVGVMKDIPKGKFKPVITVTNRQMGIK